MNNEPVAYGRYIENAKMWLVVELDADIPDGYISLYTHPAKTLTDEEIKDVYFNTFNWNFSESASSPFLDFARAILLKAQEK